MKPIYKKIFLLCSFLYFLSGNAQAPNKFSFQAVVRNSSNQLVTNQSVGVKISLISVVMSSETAEFEETHTVTTNINGLFSLKVGEGTLVLGDFTTAMNSNASSKKIKCEIDPTGGTNYTIVSNEQLLSMPYALKANFATYANNANSATTADTATTANSVNGIAGTEGYVPVFGANNAIGNSTLFNDASGNIGLNTELPTAKFEIKNTLSSTPALKITTIDNVNSTFSNSLQMEAHAEKNSINFSFWDITKAAIISNHFGDLSFYSKNAGIDINYPQFKVTQNEIELNSNFVKIGSYGSLIKALDQTSELLIGSSDVSKKVVHINRSNYNITRFHPHVTLKQEGNFSDVFSVSVTNITNFGYDIVIYRIDGTGWSQNLKASILIIEK
jgi:hypothetical protein